MQAKVASEQLYGIAELSVEIQMISAFEMAMSKSITSIETSAQVEVATRQEQRGHDTPMACRIV